MASSKPLDQSLDFEREKKFLILPQNIFTSTPAPKTTAKTICSKTEPEPGSIYIQFSNLANEVSGGPAQPGYSIRFLGEDYRSNHSQRGLRAGALRLMSAALLKTTDGIGSALSSEEKCDPYGSCNHMPCPYVESIGERMNPCTRGLTSTFLTEWVRGITAASSISNASAS